MSLALTLFIVSREFSNLGVELITIDTDFSWQISSQNSKYFFLHSINTTQIAPRRPHQSRLDSYYISISEKSDFDSVSTQRSSLSVEIFCPHIEVEAQYVKLWKKKKKFVTTELQKNIELLI